MHYWPDNLSRRWSACLYVRATLSRVIAVSPLWFCPVEITLRIPPFLSKRDRGPIPPPSSLSSFVHRDEISFPSGIVSPRGDFSDSLSLSLYSPLKKFSLGDHPGRLLKKRGNYMRAELFGNREKERDTAVRVSCKRSLIWFELETSECFLGFLE